ncbi:MAG: hypothetical protein A2940_02250 [Candidatus Wildermuthbacteria bacterium RIFCSPLOWO2_01_FULL_48_29]|uniref:Uncharacterized protein n=1 Tax=Candidatus Wildermuthbacteria bacterium RIFCSPLOWO2_01_FULL_48_29 TaxID=1802462 RepID=A0A1G2RQY6_9BACT|nr:MAG: hypothetical protein A2940_02250 [Candidatus Wildermuthbacteria bacterium RIFCSPLOWO2_01_FULL_48_29]
MYETKFPNGKTAQEIQDEIFRKMSADEKLKVGAELWSFGKEIEEGRVNYSLERLEKPTLEDLMLAKLRWQQISPSSKQFEDVESIFKVSGDQLDLEYLAEWAGKLGVQDLYAQIHKD